MDNEAYRQTFTDTGDGSNGQYGNMSCAPAGPGCLAFTYNVAKNQISNAGYSYGARGNLTGDGTYTYSWDPEAHLTAVYQSGNVVSLSTYNALGQRVEDITPTSTTDEAYGAGGNLLLRYTGDSNSRSFVPFNGRILAEYFCGGMIFDHPDEIGSLTTSTDCTGNYVNEKLFYPFGESWTGAAIPNLGAHQTFAQLPDYDAETDQYNTLFRHYTPRGRWMRPDPGGVKVVRLDDPQTWNMYAYVRNNPTTLTDPSGLTPDPPAVSPSGCVTNYGPGPCGQPPEQATQTGANTEDQNQGNPAQNTPLPSVTVLGNKISITYDPNLSADQQLAASNALVAMANVINDANLSEDEKADIQKIQTISVSAGEGQNDPRTGPSPNGNENFRFSYLMDPGSTAAWTASAFAHDAYHLVIDPKGTLYNKDPAGLEKKSNDFQRRVGAKFGLTQDQLDKIKNDTHTLYNTGPY
jgi:RHS repeat-associated protein